MKMKCVFCNKNLPEIVQASIEAIGVWCPSGCDSAVRVAVRCPHCGRVIYRKLIYIEYAYSTLKRLADKYGFEVEEIRPDDPYIEEREGIICDESSLEDMRHEAALVPRKDGLYLYIPSHSK